VRSMFTSLSGRRCRAQDDNIRRHMVYLSLCRPRKYGLLRSNPVHRRQRVILWFPDTQLLMVTSREATIMLVYSTNLARRFKSGTRCSNWGTHTSVCALRCGRTMPYLISRIVDRRWPSLSLDFWDELIWTGRSFPRASTDTATASV
jgi:hypothetical protein